MFAILCNFNIPSAASLTPLEPLLSFSGLPAIFLTFSWQTTWSPQSWFLSRVWMLYFVPIWGVNHTTPSFSERPRLFWPRRLMFAFMTCSGKCWKFCCTVSHPPTTLLGIKGQPCHTPAPANFFGPSSLLLLRRLLNFRVCRIARQPTIWPSLKFDVFFGAWRLCLLFARCHSLPLIMIPNKIKASRKNSPDNISSITWRTNNQRTKQPNSPCPSTCLLFNVSQFPVKKTAVVKLLRLRGALKFVKNFKFGMAKVNWD